MNKKQLIVTSILLSLMLVLAITQGFFKEKFEQVALIDNGISQFKEYSFDEGNYVISLPNEWTVDEKESKWQYISHKLSFRDRNNKLTGSLEIINTKGEINVFAENDLKNQSLNYFNEEVMPFKNSNYSGVLVQYKTTVNNGYNFRNECYYLDLDDGKKAKLLFNLNEKDYKENIKTVFNTIVSSINKSK